MTYLTYFPRSVIVTAGIGAVASVTLLLTICIIGVKQFIL